MRKYVVLATNTNMDYCYYAPIVAHMWHTIGYEPIVNVLGDKTEWDQPCRLRYIYDNICASARIIALQRIPGLKDTTVVQVSRLFIAAEPFDENDYILTSDVDMLPLDRKWFTSQDFNYDVNCFGGDAYPDDGLPMCYNGAKVNEWRMIMNILVSCNNINAAMKTALTAGEDDWFYDEILLKKKIKLYHGTREIIKRWPGGNPARRLDRSGWDFHGQKDLIDCHSVRPGLAHWDKLEPVFKAYCDDADYKYIKEYTENLLAMEV